MFVRELTDGQEIDQVLIVREGERRSRRDGREFLRLVLGDRTGTVTAMVWEDVAERAGCCDAGAHVRVTGRYGVHPHRGAELTVSALRPAEDQSSSSTTCSTGRRATRTAWSPTCASSSPPSRTRIC